jgi:phage terminase large subunit-like protein
MANDQNLIPAKPGDVRNPMGKPKGTLARKTIMKKWLMLEEDTVNPLTNAVERLNQFDKMTLEQIKNANDGDLNSYKVLTEWGTDQDVDERSDLENKSEGIDIGRAIIQKFDVFLERENDWSIMSGGSRSGKTYNFLLWAFMQTFKRRFDLNIIAPSFKMLELGSFVDVKSILSRFAPDIKVPERATKIDLYNGSRWQFEVVTNENEAKRNRVNVFVNEADGVPEEVANLLGRASGRKFIDFNPVKKFWAHKLINEDETNLMCSTWHDNPFLTKNQLQWFDDLKRRGENAEEGSPERYAYEVYYKGDYSLLSGKAYEMEDFDIVDEVPDKFDFMISYADPSLGTGNDFFAAVLFGIKGTQVYAVDCIFSQFVKSGGYTEKLKEWDREYKTAIDHYAESNGIGGVVTGAVQEFYTGVLNEVNNSTKKEADIIVYAPTAKRFKFRRSAKMIEFLTQCAEFPNAEHDDAPDCLSRGAKLILKHFDL